MVSFRRKLSNRSSGGFREMRVRGFITPRLPIEFFLNIFDSLYKHFKRKIMIGEMLKGEAYKNVLD